MTHISPARFRLLMRRHGWTIRTLAIAGEVQAVVMAGETWKETI